MKSYVKKLKYDVSVESAFTYYERPDAFIRIMPPWDKIKILEQKGSIHDGDFLRFNIYKGPIFREWLAVLHGYEKNKHFCDIQEKGPFKYWEHNHNFSAIGNEQCEIEEAITYELPLESVTDSLLGSTLERKLDDLFKYRRDTIVNDIFLHNRYKGKPLKILIAGSSGLVGSQLVPFLTLAGHEVVKLTRASGKTDEHSVVWRPEQSQLDPRICEGYDVIINLCGAGIADKRWTDERKKEIIDSRVLPTKLLANVISRLKNPPKVFINASATGYYGNRGDENITEESAPGAGFLAKVCREWEDAASALKNSSTTRVVFLRTGVVLTPAGGALGKMLPPFYAGLGGVIGSGEQFISWIGIDDLIGIIQEAIINDRLSGPINGVAPNPVNNKDFTNVLGNVINRPTVLNLPKIATKLVFGEMGEEMLLSGAKVLPKKVEEVGYPFLYPYLEPALRHLLGK
jgi:uncharacterized protein (TIGR01777 family)